MTAASGAIFCLATARQYFVNRSCAALPNFCHNKFRTVVLSYLSHIACWIGVSLALSGRCREQQVSTAWFRLTIAGCELGRLVGNDWQDVPQGREGSSCGSQRNQRPQGLGTEDRTMTDLTPSATTQPLPAHDESAAVENAAALRGAVRAPGPLRSAQRARCLRRRLHRPHEGREVAPDRHATASPCSKT